MRKKRFSLKLSYRDRPDGLIAVARQMKKSLVDFDHAAQAKKIRSFSSQNLSKNRATWAPSFAHATPQVLMG
jgi:hypothetical protein